MTPIKARLKRRLWFLTKRKEKHKLTNAVGRIDLVRLTRLTIKTGKRLEKLWTFSVCPPPHPLWSQTAGCITYRGHKRKRSETEKIVLTLTTKLHVLYTLNCYNRFYFSNRLNLAQPNHSKNQKVTPEEYCRRKRWSESFASKLLQTIFVYNNWFKIRSRAINQ